MSSKPGVDACGCVDMGEEGNLALTCLTAPRPDFARGRAKRERERDL